MKEVATESPAETDFTPAPTLTTTPEPSWPPIIGNGLGIPGLVLGHDEVTRDEVLLRMAKARRLPLDEHLSWGGIMDIYVFDLPGLANAPKNCCTALHVTLLIGSGDLLTRVNTSACSRTFAVSAVNRSRHRWA
jgi:hypothetical protein